MKDIIISLFDYSGTWSDPYRKAGYTVIQVDIKHGQDILTWYYKKVDKSRVYGILAAPPCTDFCRAGAVFWKRKDENGSTEKSINLVKKTLEVVNYFNPDFWVLENPAGRLDSLVPELKPLKLYSFHPYEFGEAYSKLTYLYGRFNPWLIKKYVKPYKQKGSEFSFDVYLLDKHQSYRSKSFAERSEMRSITPAGFAEAFFNANNNLGELRAVV